MNELSKSKFVESLNILASDGNHARTDDYLAALKARLSGQKPQDDPPECSTDTCPTEGLCKTDAACNVETCSAEFCYVRTCLTEFCYVRTCGQEMCKVEDT